MTDRSLQCVDNDRLTRLASASVGTVQALSECVLVLKCNILLQERFMSDINGVVRDSLMLMPDG